MPDRSHLIPAQTVNRRGWLTTVYRRAFPAKATAGGSAVPSLPPIGAATAPAPASFPAPSRRSRWEVSALARKLERKGDQQAFRRMTATSEGAAAAALALDTIESGSLGEYAVLGAVAETSRLGAGALSDSLRIAAPVVEDIIRREGPGTGGWQRRSFNRRVQAIVNGLRRADPAGGPTVTDEQSLASAVAVALFVHRLSLRGASADALTGNDLCLPEGGSQHRIFLRDEGLEQLLRDHPGELESIIEYADQNDLSDPEAVHALRAVLEGQVAAPVADGWL